MGAPKVRAMAEAAVHAGLLPNGKIEELFDDKQRSVESAYLQGLDEMERVRAVNFISQAKEAVVQQWDMLLQGSNASSTQTLAADTAYLGDGEHSAGPREVSEEESDDSAVSRRGLSALHVQKEMCKLQDSTRLRALEARLRNQANWAKLE